MMKENSIRRAVRGGRAALGTGLKEFASRGVPWIIEAAGFDYCAIDHEHGAFDMETIADLASWFQATNVTAIVRIHKSFAHLIPGILDQGIMGIQVSEVETAQEARVIVRLAKYPPIGNRGISGQGPHTGYKSYGPRHATLYVPGPTKHHPIPFDRFARGPGDVEEIAAVEGIDMIAYGHSDLSAQLGVHLDLEHRPSKRQCGGSQRRAMRTASSLGDRRRPRRRSRQLEARVQGAEPAGERREHLSRRDEIARGPCTCAAEVDWGADPMRGRHTRPTA